MISPDYITIPLTKGQETIVDPIDADLADLNWYALESKSGGYYAVRHGSRKTVPRPTFLMHRVILERKLGRSLTKGEFPDHEDGNGLDNRRCNLRLATHQQNMRNSRVKKSSKSGITGVFWNKKHNKWQADITINRKTKYLGLYAELQDAIKARKEAEEKYFGEFRRKE